MLREMLKIDWRVASLLALFRCPTNTNQNLEEAFSFKTGKRSSNYGSKDAIPPPPPHSRRGENYNYIFNSFFYYRINRLGKWECLIQSFFEKILCIKTVKTKSKPTISRRTVERVKYEYLRNDKGY